MKFAKERAQIISSQIRQYAVEQTAKVTGWQVKEGCYLDSAEVDAAAEPWRDFDNDKDRWYGKDRHYWFRANITIPEDMDGKAVWLLVRTELEEWNDGHLR